MVKKKLLLSKLRIPNLSKEQTPLNIKISVNTDISHLKLSDIVRVRTTIIPIPEQVYPDGFDFQRFAYFKQLGAVGYATSKVYIRKKYKHPKYLPLNKVRELIADRITANVSNKEVASIAKALLIGDKTAISDSVYNNMRVAGLAHILAISGMHIAIVVTFIFVLCRFFLTCIIYKTQSIFLQLNSKKISAIVAIIISLIYLIISGSPVSAQRAFIMSTFVLLAIILEQDICPMHSLAIAAILILIATPEVLLGASFQMSFAACGCLIFAFNNAKNYFSNHTSLLKKILNYFIAIIFSTLVAGVATIPFVIYHFNQFSTYSLLANLVAIPLNSFIIMPSGIISLFFMPLGIESLPLQVMELGISAMLKAAFYIEALPYSSFFIPAFTDTGIALIALGMVLICFCATRQLRLLALVPIIIGLSSIHNYKHPDIIIDGKAKMFVVKQGDDFFISTRRYRRYIQKVWANKIGKDRIENIKKAKLTNCTSQKCIVGKVVLLNGGILDECKDIELIINLADEQHSCDMLTLDRNYFLKNGGTNIWFSENGFKIANVANHIIIRKWHQYQLHN